MLWVVLSLLVLVGLAGCIVVAVALPHLREGTPVLTPEGERLMREAKARLTNTPAD